MMTVKEVRNLTGVSIRTLRYYDQIGLLPATDHTESGYRLYDDAALEQLQQILLFRELEFPLGQIRQILSSPNYDKDRALQQQIELLQLKRERLDRLILLARGIKNIGGRYMDFSAFDSSKLEDYACQAKQSWGHTQAYREFEEKTRDIPPGAQEDAARGLMAIFAEMGQIKTGSPEKPEAQRLVEKLQGHITRHYYTCTRQILKGLGQMYAAGGEFTENIDAVGGPGTAEFANAAIEIYCK